MKKRRMSALLLAGALCASLVGCNTNGTNPDSIPSIQEEASGSAKYNVSVILKTLAAEYWQYVKAGAEGFAAEHPDLVTVDVKGPSSETAFDEMQNMIETTLSSNNYDALIISPLQSDAATHMVSGTKLPIIAVDTNFEAPEVVSFVGTGNEEAAKKGAIAAVEIAKKAGWETIQCIEIAGVEGDDTSAARIRGYQAGIEEAGGEFLTDEIQYADAMADRAANSMEAIMQTHPEGIAIICAHNDDVAMSAARVAASNPAYANTIFLGFNGDRAACNAILSGQLTMSVAQMAYEMGYKAVETMIAYLEGETVEAFVDSGSDVITADNAEQRLAMLDEQLGA